MRKKKFSSIHEAAPDSDVCQSSKGEVSSLPSLDDFLGKNRRVPVSLSVLQEEEFSLWQNPRQKQDLGMPAACLQEFFPQEREYRIPRERMVSQQLEARGITDSLVLSAMRTVPRHCFVPEAFVPTAYEDRPLPIGYGQTISQPYIVAQMCQLLRAKPGMRVLEVGMGSGYQAAVLFRMGLKVFTVERLEALFHASRALLAKLGMPGIRTLLSDGTLGWPVQAPFDRIIVAAGGPDVPYALLEQLSEGGVLVIPVGNERQSQELLRVARIQNRFHSESCGSVSFVDLVGKQGW